LTLPIAALLTAAEADGPMARALIAKKTPEIEEVIAQGRQEGFAEGVARGRAEAVIAVLDARSVALDTADRARILGELDPALLERWLVRAATCDRIGQLFEV
jgi:flagellar biosynthesis/type III secretory pathway protein FliH